EDADSTGARADAVEDWQEENQLRNGMLGANNDDQVPELGAATYPNAGSGGGAVPEGGAVPRSLPGEGVTSVNVCMYTDLGPQVVSLPSCEDLASAEEPESDESDEEESAEAPEPVIITVTQSDFAELPLEGPGVHLQPDREWFLVNMDTFVYTD